MSKGSTPRPFSVSDIEYKRRWEETFSKQPAGYGEDKDCGYPFCSCAKKCEVKREPTNDEANS